MFWRVVSQVLFLDDHLSKPSNFVPPLGLIQDFLKAFLPLWKGRNFRRLQRGGLPLFTRVRHVLSGKTDIVSVAPTGGYPPQLTLGTLLSAAWTFLTIR